jgi:hypothetical protein
LAKRAKDASERFGRLLRALITEEGVNTVDRIVARMDIKTSVRPSARKDYVHRYLNGTRNIESAWAWQIGHSILLPWCSGAWGLWSAGRFEDFLWLLQLSMETTADDWIQTRALQMWRFMDALQHVCIPLPHDDLPEIVKINADRAMPFDAFQAREVFAILGDENFDGSDEMFGRLMEDAYDIFVRQAAKRVLFEVGVDLYPIFDLNWSPIEDPEYQQFYGADEESRRVIYDDILPQMRLPEHSNVINSLDQFVDIHFESAMERARAARGEVATRADMICNDVLNWAGHLYQRFGGVEPLYSIRNNNLAWRFAEMFTGERRPDATAGAP